MVGIFQNIYLSDANKLAVSRSGVRSMRGLGPTMTTRDLDPTMTALGQSIGISIGMLPQTLIMSKPDQLSLGARI
jgi:hypothetical protein